MSDNIEQPSDDQKNSSIVVSNNQIPRQAPSNFLIIEPLFYEEFNNIEPILPDWTIERMPRNVNTNRIKLDRNNMCGGWFYGSYNTKGKFRCLKCMKRRKSLEDATWYSAYTTILFRVYYGPDTDENGQIWIGGWIQMKVFAQSCKECYEYVTGELEAERPKNLVKWLHRWIAHCYYGYPMPRVGYQGVKHREPHRVNLCEACKAGWCHYRGNSYRRNTTISTES